MAIILSTDEKWGWMNGASQEPLRGGAAAFEVCAKTCAMIASRAASGDPAWRRLRSSNLALQERLGGGGMGMGGVGWRVLVAMGFAASGQGGEFVYELRPNVCKP
jgi:hypothetical protein